ncbi:MAG TPA: hypothetical protein VFB78_05190 [Acidimicrobiales bacterium]|nr:hypothetical protein [Acidimicrobiales bacterium]
MATTTYRSRSTKRKTRRSRAEIAAIKVGLFDIVASQHPATVRGVFYQAVSRGLVAKTESEYKQTVIRLLVNMRRAGELPFGWVADETRWMRKPASYSSLADMLSQTSQLYRRALWDDQDSYVEVWLEKEAISGAIYEVTSVWDVPLMPTRGYPSLTFLHHAAEAMAAQAKPASIYYLGDHDPSGLDIPRVIERELRRMAPNTPLSFTRLAVTVGQIERYDLPTRPTKVTDSRARDFSGGRRGSGRDSGP